MRCLVLALLATACSQPTPPPPVVAPPVAVAPPIDAAPATPTEPLAAPEPEPVDAGAAPEPLVNPATDSGPRSTFQCFAWIHGPEFSTDCYRTAEKCEVAKKTMAAGARDTQPCKAVVGASCTSVGRRKMKKEEHCFGDAANCERYRAFVTGNGLEPTACVNK